ncbi:ABC transporter ATP-binding protein [Alphaproteobacteria bacterium]|nr:ABC transporter ATP-binding protein [Alphaproteobacteria bacterium]
MSSNTVLKASDLNKSFSGIVAAKNINVSINQGEIVGIIGANGAGKTVFVNMITGYLKPTSGKIEFLGTDITGIEPREATHIGLCRSFQISQVFMTMTVKQNLMIAMSLAKKSGKQLLDPIDDDKISKECDSILELYKIKDQKNNIVSTLSQGIRKLLDIAMAVVGNPKVILLDEPTSGVSVEEKFGIMDIVIAALKQTETSVLFVEHDMEIVERYVDRVMAFYQGEIICDAPPKEALSDKKVIEYVLGH